jgi:hypothetical protein
MLSLMVTIEDYCPGMKLTKDGVAAFQDVWIRGERRFGGLFMTRCIIRNVTDGRVFHRLTSEFLIRSDWCDMAFTNLEGWRSAMTKKRGPLAEKNP